MFTLFRKSILPLLLCLFSLCLSCCGYKDDEFAAEGFVPKKARDLKIDHPKIPPSSPKSTGSLPDLATLNQSSLALHALHAM